MRVGLIDIEPNIYNTALMQIAMSYVNAGIDVKWASPLEYDKYDRLYCSSLFSFTDKSQVPRRVICGGTGFDIKKKLDVSSAKSQLDYSIYPKCKTSYIWFSRGCDRNCPWCVVRKKEGRFHLVKRKQLNPNGRYVTVMDNDFFANPEWENVISWLGQMPVDIQSIDVRTITKEQCKALNRLRRWKNKQFKIAWDNPKEDLVPKLKFMIRFVKLYKIMCYVLIGFNSTEAQDLHRVERLRSLKIDPFVMPFDKNDPYQKKFARYANHKAIFKTVKWKDYLKGAT